MFAAGGRYDSLVRENRHYKNINEERHAVGFNLAWEKMARLPKSNSKSFLKKHDEEVQGMWSTKRVSIRALVLSEYSKIKSYRNHR